MVLFFAIPLSKKNVRSKTMSNKSVIGGDRGVDSTTIELNVNMAHKTNKEFWNTIGSEFLGVTALPQYGAFVSEDKIAFAGGNAGKKGIGNWLWKWSFIKIFL